MFVRANRTIHVQTGTAKEGNVKTVVIPKGKSFETGQAIPEEKAKRMLANRQLAVADRDMVDVTGTLGEDKRDAGDGRPVGKASTSVPEQSKTVK